MSERRFTLDKLIAILRGAADDEAALADVMPPSRLRHSLGAAALAGELAVRYGYPDPAEITRAALWHDVGRAASADSVPGAAAAMGWPPDAEEAGNPELLHGPAGAAVAAACGLGKAAAAAIRYHVTSRPGAPQADMIIMAADAAEPYRRFQWADGARAALSVSLEMACAYWLSVKIEYVRARGAKVHPRGEEALATYDAALRTEAERLAARYCGREGF